MVPKVQEKEKAIELRRKGYSYKDILKEIPVAKSSLSNWLKDLPLTDQEKHYLKDRRSGNISQGRIRAATSNHMRRVVRDGFLFQEARKEFKEKSKNPLFHIGIALYWAEGAKRNSFFGFTNSDPEMIHFMMKWIRTFLQVKDEEIGLRLFTHKPFANDDFEGFWLQQTGLNSHNLKKTIYKPSGMVKKRPNYKGCVRIEVMRVNHLRRLIFWQKMLIEHYRKKG